MHDLTWSNSSSTSDLNLHATTKMTTVNAQDDKPDVIMIETAIRDDLEGNPDKAPQIFHIDGFSVLGLSPEDAEFYQNYSAKDRKKTMHKVSHCNRSSCLTQLTK